MKNSFLNLLTYYERERSYLKNMGAIFAAQYPKVARRLDIGHDEISDPHVSRLIDSFAFLTASLQQDIDNEFPRISTALLEALYPQFSNPIPSFSIAQFQVDPSKGKLTSGFSVPKETSVFAYASEGVTCQFQTGYDVELWPIEVSEASLVKTNIYNFPNFFTNDPYCLRIRLTTLEEPLKTLGCTSLRFYIKGTNAFQTSLYESLFLGEKPLGVALKEGDQVKILPKNSLNPVGFSQEETVLPLSSRTHPAYGLLLEYYYCTDKFFFFDISNLDMSLAETNIDLLIPVSNVEILLKLSLSKDNFCLGCTPIINIFKKISEPFKLSQYTTEHRLVADQRRELTTEIHSLISVQGIAPDGLTTQTIPPYFSFDYEASTTSQEFFWYARRTPSTRSGLPGTDIELSFVNLDFNPATPSRFETIFAYTLCTNRSLAPELPAGTLLEVNESFPIHNVVCLKSPTSPVYPPTEGATLWGLISQLSLNKLSLSNSPQSIERLQGILNLYTKFGNAESNSEIESLVGMACSYNVERMGNEAWRNFARGISITLTLDESKTGGKSPFLFTAVLNQFFGLYVSLNSFTQLNIQKLNQEGYWKQWAPLSGTQPLL
ncbi:MAG: type VI secretion system baseplate subunit TssF [Proteobacteria bacterium]|nr:type VI secretion system baseplate subunit TssF [Pseudomonadota bacterium]